LEILRVISAAMATSIVYIKVHLLQKPIYMGLAALYNLQKPPDEIGSHELVA